MALGQNGRHRCVYRIMNLLGSTALSYSDEYEFGFIECRCCESNYCSGDTVYNTSIHCCVPMNDNMDSLNLFQKDIPTCEIIEDGASGFLKYNLAGPEFVFDFNGQGLQAGAGYVLI